MIPSNQTLLCLSITPPARKSYYIVSCHKHSYSLGGRNMTTSKAIAVVSGGVDSVTLAYLLQAQGHELHLLSFDYGQRHKKELFFAELCARRLNAAFDVIDLTAITRFLKGSALTDAVPVPEGHYAAPNMAIT